MEISNTDISTFLNMVDTFYNNAWNRLVLYAALIIVIAGIVLPIILQFVSQRIQQSKNTEMENKLREKLTNSINLKAKSIEENNRNIIDNYFKEKEKTIENNLVQIKRNINFSIGLNYHNLALQSVKGRDYIHRISYPISAGISYINAKNESELKKMLRVLEKHCLDLNKINDSFEVEELKKSLHNFFSKLEVEYPDERYSSEIKRIKKAIFNASKA